MSNIIFLDVDGVLNNCTSRSDLICDNSFYLLNSCNVQILLKLIEETNSLVVLSSTWRKYAVAVSFLESNGIDILDSTPILDTLGSLRGNEIRLWMLYNASKYISKNDSYIILDDDSDMLYWQRNNFLLVDNMVGLTNNVAYKAKRMLSNELSY